MFCLLFIIFENFTGCPIESFLESKSITFEKLKYILIGIAGLIFILFTSTIVLSIVMCCVCSKNKARIEAMSEDISTERGYRKWLEFQQRYQHSYGSNTS